MINVLPASRNHICDGPNGNRREDDRRCSRSDPAKSNVICRTTEQMVKNHMVKVTEGYMVNTFNPKQATNESDEQKGNKISSSEILMLLCTLDSMARGSRGPRVVLLSYWSSYWRWGVAGEGRQGSRHGWFSCVNGNAGAEMGTVPSLRCCRQPGEGRSKPGPPAPTVLSLPGHPVRKATVRVGMAMSLCKQWRRWR